MAAELSNRALLRRIRWLLGFFMVGLILSGITAFPLEPEMAWLDRILSGSQGPAQTSSGLAAWIHVVHLGLHQTYAQYPWVAYGTDWLAFGHFIIAIFFIGPWINPVRNIWALQTGLIACVAVFPLAMICGPIRHIPFGWQLIDCTFGFFGIFPLYFCWRWTKRLEQQNPRASA